MSGLLLPILLVGGVIVFIKRCEWLGMCDTPTPEPTVAAIETPTATPNANLSADAIKTASGDTSGAKLKVTKIGDNKPKKKVRLSKNAKRLAGAKFVKIAM